MALRAVGLFFVDNIMVLVYNMGILLKTAKSDSSRAMVKRSAWTDGRHRLTRTGNIEIFGGCPAAVMSSAKQ